MKSCFFLAVHFYLTCVYSAPLSKNVHMNSALERGMSLAKKILNDIPRVHEACVRTAGLTLELSSEATNLEYLLSDMGIPAPPALKAISEDHTLAMSLSGIEEGLKLHRELLQDVRVQTSSEELNVLLADIRDLSLQIQEMQMLGKIPITVSQKTTPGYSLRLNNEYQVQVAIHLSLQQLRSFTQDVFRSLRHIAVSH